MITNTIKINIRDNCVTNEDAIKRVQSAMSSGRCSNDNKNYCFATKFIDNIIVISDKKKYDIFDIYKENRNGN